MNKFCVLLDKFRSSTCCLSLFHSLPLKGIPQSFSLLFTHNVFLPPKWIFPNGKQTYCFHSISKKSPSLDLTLFKLRATSLLFFAENAKKKVFIHLISNASSPILWWICSKEVFSLATPSQPYLSISSMIASLHLMDSAAFDTAEYFDNRTQPICFSTISLLFFILVSWLLPSSLCQNALGLSLCTSSFSICTHFLNGFLQKSCFKIPFKHLWLTEFSYS